MGTLFTITLYAPDETTARTASDAAFAKVAALERVMTDYDPESEVMKLCQHPVNEPVRVSDELFEVLQEACRVAELSAGAFDPTIGPIVRLWRRARRTGELPSAELLAKARAAVGWQNLKLNRTTKTVMLARPGMQIDLGGIGKGFAADKALRVLREHGVTRALIAASGDIAVSSAPPGQGGWSVGIGSMERERSDLAKKLLLENAAVSTAGDSEQFVEINGIHYSHIVDSRTGLGLTNRLQVSVIARTATETDAFDTAVRALGAERGLKLIESQPGLAAFVLIQEGDRTKTIESKRFRRIQIVQ